MLKKILSYGAVEGIAKGLNRGLILIIPLIISAESYGKVGLIVSGEFLLPILGFLGLDRTIIRFFHEKEKYQGFTSTIFTTVTLAHLTLFLIYACFLFSESDSLIGIDKFPSLFILLINIYLLNVVQIILNIQRVSENHKTYFAFRVIFQICKFVFVVGLSLYFKNEWGYLIGVLISLIIVILYQFKLFLNELSFSINTKTLKTLMLFCWPFIFHSIAGNILGNVDRFILEEYVDLKIVGIYTFAFSLASSISFAFQGVSVYLEPLIYKSKDVAERENKLAYYNKFALLGGSILFIIITGSSEFVISNFFSSDYLASIPFIPIIGLGHLFMPFYFKANYRLVYNKKPMSIAQISISTAVISIALNLIFIPLFGVWAAAIISFSSLFLLSFLLILSSNSWKWNFECNSLSLILLISLVTIYFDHILLYIAFAFVIAGIETFKLYKIRSIKA